METKDFYYLLYLQERGIVNTTGKTLDLSGNPVGVALAQGAGPQLQAACNNLAPLSGGQVKVTDGFGLNCAKVLHCRVGVAFDGSAVSETASLFFAMDSQVTLE